MKIIFLLSVLFQFHADGADEGTTLLVRKRSMFVELEPQEPPAEFEISAEEEARLERFLQASSLSLPDVPTVSPTKAPTASPSTKPSVKPSSSPVDTQAPSHSPVRTPTISPITPTVGPSSVPSILKPSDRPATDSPVAPTPTASPTRAPTGTPTKSPTGTPTKPPTNSPTGTPTKSPTRSPNAIFIPTKSPTKTPTDSPTAATPTSSPTDDPTDNPTASTPTKSPTDSPTSTNVSPTKSPTKNPTINPTASPTTTVFTGTCSDDPNYYHKFEMRKCAFIDEEQWRREKYCKVKEVYDNCERTCGKCCEDTPSSDFTFDVRGKQRGCEWITLRAIRPGLFCDNIVSTVGSTNTVVSDYCPAACGTCRSVTIVPTAAPVGVCSNNDSWHYPNLEKVTCKWIRNKEKRRLQYCPKGTVTYHCPQSCGLCCEDHPNYKFRDFDIKKDITCAYVGSNAVRRAKYCDLYREGTMVKNACPVACQECKTPIGGTVRPTASPNTSPTTTTTSPTKSPTKSPTTAITGSCQNDPNWTWFGFPQMTCKWIRKDETRREDYCNRNPIVKTSCPQTCGICCEDDNTYSMNTQGSMTCEWISESANRISKYCDKYKNGRMVPDACPVTCNRCLSPV